MAWVDDEMILKVKPICEEFQEEFPHGEDLERADQGGLESPSLEVSEQQLDIGLTRWSNVGLDDLAGLFQDDPKVWDPPWSAR